MAGNVLSLVLRSVQIFLLAAVVILHAALAQSTVIVTSKTITGTTTVTTSAFLLTNCDGVGTFFCPTGTCYTGNDGFIGCCTVSSCAARTTCIPYTANVLQTCNVDTGGCVVCPSAVPSCVTIKNVAMDQYIMYCDAFSTVVTLSYTNLVTNGSTALSPASSSDPFVPLTLNSASSTSSTTFDAAVATETSIAFHTAAATQPNTTADFSGLSRGVVGGITVSCVIAVAGAVIIFMVMLRRHRKNSHNRSNEKSGPANAPQYIPDRLVAMSIDERSGRTSPRMLQKIPYLRRGGPLPVMRNGNSQHECLAPTIHHSPASAVEDRVTERTHELDGITTPATAAIFHSPNFSPETSRDVRPSWFTPLQKNHNDVGILKLQNSIDHASLNSNLSYQNTHSIIEPVELPTIRQVQPSGNFDSASPTSTYPVTPDPDTHLISPIVGGLSPQTPLMSRWQASDHVSVGQTTPDPDSSHDPAATLSTSTKRSTPSYSMTKRDEVQVGGRMQRSLTGATGGAERYVSPEMAMAEGLDGVIESEREREDTGKQNRNWDVVGL